MFAKISKVKKGKQVYEYLRLVESYREKGKKKQRVVANLGAVGLLKGKLDGVVDKLREYCSERYVKPNEITAQEIPTWGTVLVARKLWNDLKIGKIIKRRCCERIKGADIETLAFMLTASSLIKPSSEHGLGWWLDESYVCGGDGKRILPDWRQGVTKENRVRISWKQLKQWYRVLNILLRHKEEIEKDIYDNLVDLFGLKVDVVFYDITSLYFEGEGPEGLAEYGKSKDGKGRNRQVLLGIVMASGWPVAHHVFSGNSSEKKTVPIIIEDLKKRFKIEKIIFVGDSGMTSSENIKEIERQKYKYIIAQKRRRNKEVEKVLADISDKWLICEKGTKVKEVNINEGTRHFVVYSEGRQSYEHSIVENNLKKTNFNLERLKKEINRGEIKKPEDIGYKVSSVLNKAKGYRYFSWEIAKAGKFQYWQDEEKMKKEKAIEGTYVLKSNDKKITPQEAVTAYKELCNVESLFREFKDVLEGRPIWHQTEQGTKAHIFIRALGYLLDTALHRKMEKAGVNLTVEEAIKSLEQVKIGELKLKGEKRQIVTGAKYYAGAVLKSVGLCGYKNLLPGMI
ncbi:MAG: IS1634 family transposase [Candidatus Omnitrophota bacterium]